MPNSDEHLLLTEPWRPLCDTEPFRARDAARMRFSSGALLIGSDVGSRLTSVRSRISLASLRAVRSQGSARGSNVRVAVG